MYTYLCRTRWGDMDAFGHINNLKVLQYVQEAVYCLLYDESEGQGLFEDGFMIARHEIDYRTPLYHCPAPLPVQIWVERLGRASIGTTCEARRDGELVFEARTVTVPTDAGTGRSRPLRDAERRHLNRYRVRPIGPLSTVAPVGRVPVPATARLRVPAMGGRAS
ncbi:MULTISPECIES: acyl-CoA thioesterase [Kitasatospora]|uniref:acyl-CoA thioesterase n=1 Tax=Kitasatospora TaxID=2063 RepID=UPI0006988FBF|nr:MULTISPECIES: thioesterase family protein [Kitasatospora]PJN26285.1 thioesterase [Kitasatospora sp. CB02891]